ncbi:MAG TPA: endolytic transglycosylase MltG [Anaerolineae bacterium]|nr:endolytic transglycosylase MltG [Anaerolineae bacterium]
MKPTNTGATRRLGCLLLLVACLAIPFALFFSFALRQERLAAELLPTGESSALNPIEKRVLQSNLVQEADELAVPQGAAVGTVTFTIESGSHAPQIAAQLVQLGLLTAGDQKLFLDYLRYYGLDARLEAGTFYLQAPLTIPELAEALTNAGSNDINLRFIEGWRLEEMADHIRQTKPAQIDADEYLAIAQRRQPIDLSSYDFLASLPADASFEGYLFPDTYRLDPGATATDLINIQLLTFGQKVSPRMRQAFGAQGLTLREAITLASIIEREAVLQHEKPIMADVFLNRLEQGIKLDADPTVQYALGYDSASQSWWKYPLYIADLQYDSPYNTYVYPGIPPGPIANPGLASFQALAEPEPNNFIFFVADCIAQDSSHFFSATYEEHLARVQQCR